jgi:hypothetical protein
MVQPNLALPNRVVLVDGKVNIIRPGEVGHDHVGQREDFVPPLACDSHVADSLARAKRTPDPRYCELYALAAHDCKTNLLDQVRLSTIQRRLDADPAPTVWRDFVTAYEQFAFQQQSFLTFDIERMEQRFREGLVQQTGFDKQGRPIVFVFRGLESRTRDFSGRAAQQREYAGCAHLAAFQALAKRPADVEEIVFYVECTGSKALNFSLTHLQHCFSVARGRLGCIRRVVFFNCGFAERAVVAALRESGLFDVSDASGADIGDYVADVAGLPPQFQDLECYVGSSGGTPGCDALISLARRVCGLGGVPQSMTEVYNAEVYPTFAQRQVSRHIARLMTLCTADYRTTAQGRSPLRTASAMLRKSPRLRLLSSCAARARSSDVAPASARWLTYLLSGNLVWPPHPAGAPAAFNGRAYAASALLLLLILLRTLL